MKDSAKQFLPDLIFLILLHRKHIGHFPNLFRPKTFNEKILLRSFRPDPKYSALTDKLAVRDYVRAKVGEEHLVPLISSPCVFTRGVFDNLPDSFVMKANHGSSFVEIVSDKSQRTFENLQLLASRWVSTDFYKIARERHYRNIPRRIFFEHLLLDEQGQIPADYKVHCFGGRPGRPMMYIVVISDRFGSDTRGDVYDAEWNHLDVQIGPYIRSTTPRPPPLNLESILETAAVLAQDFNYVRVDLYALNSGVYFGELTFTPSAGVVPMRPDGVDLEWGRLLT